MHRDAGIELVRLGDEPRLFWHKSNSNDPDRNVWPIFIFSLGFRPPAFVDQRLDRQTPHGICTGTNNRVNSAPLGVEPITKLFAGVENMTDDGVKKPDTSVSMHTRTHARARARAHTHTHTHTQTHIQRGVRG